MTTLQELRDYMTDTVILEHKEENRLARNKRERDRLRAKRLLLNKTKKLTPKDK